MYRKTLRLGLEGAGTAAMQLSKGRATVAPAPRRKVRREICHLWRLRFMEVGVGWRLSLRVEKKE
jgi:hypothetical protein